MGRFAGANAKFVERREAFCFECIIILLNPWLGPASASVCRLGRELPAWSTAFSRGSMAIGRDRFKAKSACFLPPADPRKKIELLPSVS
jgi:hypothetical protein